MEEESCIFSDDDTLNNYSVMSFSNNTIDWSSCLETPSLKSLPYIDLSHGHRSSTDKFYSQIVDTMTPNPKKYASNIHKDIFNAKNCSHKPKSSFLKPIHIDRQRTSTPFPQTIDSNLERYINDENLEEQSSSGVFSLTALTFQSINLAPGPKEAPEIFKPPPPKNFSSFQETYSPSFSLSILSHNTSIGNANCLVFDLSCGDDLFWSDAVTFVLDKNVNAPVIKSLQPFDPESMGTLLGLSPVFSQSTASLAMIHAEKIPLITTNNAKDFISKSHLRETNFTPSNVIHNNLNYGIEKSCNMGSFQPVMITSKPFDGPINLRDEAFLTKDYIHLPTHNLSYDSVTDNKDGVANNKGGAVKRKLTFTNMASPKLMNIETAHPPKIFTGFKTARGSEVLVREASLLHATSSLNDDCDKTNRSSAFYHLDQPSPKMNSIKSEINSMPLLPQSDSPKPKTNENEFADLDVADFEVRTSPLPVTHNASIIKLNGTIPTGFQTASGSEVRIDAESLARARIAILATSENTQDMTTSDQNFKRELQNICAIATPFVPPILPFFIKDEFMPFDDDLVDEGSHDAIYHKDTPIEFKAIVPFPQNKEKNLTEQPVKLALNNRPAKSESTLNQHACGYLFAIKNGPDRKRICLRRLEKLEKHQAKRHMRIDRKKSQSNDAPNSCSSQLKPSIHSITFDSVDEYRFDLREHRYDLKFMPKAQNFTDAQLFWVTKDDAKIPIPGSFKDSNKDTHTDRNFFLDREDIYRIFVEIPGVDVKLLQPFPRKWVFNHYKWIVTKLASMELRFPLTLGGRLLSPHNTLSQLKYRYDREIDRCHRSCIKKITEHDDVPGKTMILFVSAIFEDANEAKCLELCDGWYPIKCLIDKPLMDLVKDSKIKLGDKLCVSQARFISGCEPDIPLEAYENTKLFLSYNSVRRCRWFTKLGYFPSQRPIQVSLTSLNPFGGNAPRLKLIVLKKYPIIYIEKTKEGISACYNERTFDRRSNVEYGSNPSHEDMGKNSSSIHPELVKITRVLKFRVTDISCVDIGTNPHVTRSFLLAIYDSSILEALTAVTIRTLTAFNLTVRSLPVHETAMVGNFQLAANASSVFEWDRKSTGHCEEDEMIVDILSNSVYDPTSTKINVNQKLDRYHLEIDVIGMVVHINQSDFLINGSHLTFVYLVCRDMHFVSLKFLDKWASFKDMGLSDMLRIGNTVACSNLYLMYSSSLVCSSTQKRQKLCSSAQFTDSMITFTSVNNFCQFNKCPNANHMKCEMGKFEKWIQENFWCERKFLKCATEILSEYLTTRKIYSSPNMKSNMADLKFYELKHFLPTDVSTPFNNLNHNSKRKFGGPVSTSNISRLPRTDSNNEKSSFFSFQDDIGEDFYKSNRILPNFNKKPKLADVDTSGELQSHLNPLKKLPAENVAQNKSCFNINSSSFNTAFKPPRRVKH
ncbi:unnamed protein product [Gordionus sp. m RMFG-2023]